MLIKSDEITQKTQKTCALLKCRNLLARPRQQVHFARIMNKSKHRNESQISVFISFKVFGWTNTVGWMDQCTMEKVHMAITRGIFSWTEFNVCNVWSALHLTMMLYNAVNWKSIELNEDWINYFMESIMTWISFFHIDLTCHSLDAFSPRNVGICKFIDETFFVQHVSLFFESS